MEAHYQFVKSGFTNVSSFGTNGRVKLPGASPDEPIVFEFGVTYEHIYQHLKKDVEHHYLFAFPLSSMFLSLLIAIIVLST